jgi:putative methyltransferase (TIGR04325 family)
MRGGRALSAFVPPVLLNLKRQLDPPAPMFSGVFPTADATQDHAPWTSEAWLLSARKELESALCAESQPLGSLVIPTLVVNLLCSQGRTCRVLDFGGGAGIAYFRIRPFLTHRHQVRWVVVDNDRLMTLGEQYRRGDETLLFSDAIPEEPVDLVFINTALQYVTDSWAVLTTLLERRPSFVVLTRLIAGNVTTHFSRQNNIPGGKAPCLFLSLPDVVAFFTRHGFQLVHRSFASEDAWGASHFEDVPDAEQVRNTVNLVFEAHGDKRELS